MARESAPSSLRLLLLVATCVLTVASAYVNPRNPCHAKRDLGAGNTCLIYVVPPALCSVCRLKDTNSGGKFADCRGIYDVGSDACRREVRRYAYKNRKCDPLRVAQVADYDNQLEPLDFFLYAVCEECCDCVPTGALQREYDSRKRAKTLFDVAGRANCGTHAAVDVCKVWPKVRGIVNWSGRMPTKTKIDALPDVCPMLQKWRSARAGRNSKLSQEEKDTVPLEAQPFLKQFVGVARCGNRRTWQRCVSLERNQSRI